IDGVETVDVFFGENAAKGGDFVDVWREGGLDEDSVDGGIRVLPVDEGEEFFVGDGGRKNGEAAVDADFGGGFLFFVYVGNRGWIFADADEGDARFLVELANFRGEFVDDLGGDFVSVDEFGHDFDYFRRRCS